MHVDLKALDGRWHDILPVAAGIDKAILTGKHAPCPICEGKKSFRFDNKQGSGSWICSHCGGGYPPTLVMKRLGCDYRQAMEEIGRAAGVAPMTTAPKPRESDEEHQRSFRAALWKGSAPITPGSAPGSYLDFRCAAAGSYPRELRAGAYTWDGVRYPAMIARVLSADGARVNQLQCVLLTREGRKAQIDDAKITTPGSFPMGGAVRLASAAEEMGICEGVETALSCAKMFNVPTWAALDARHLETWEPPPQCKLLHVFGDHDGPPYYTGERAAYILANRVAHRKIRPMVHLPPEPKTDWNDIHQHQRA